MKSTNIDKTDDEKDNIKLMWRQTKDAVANSANQILEWNQNNKNNLFKNLFKIAIIFIVITKRN